MNDDESESDETTSISESDKENDENKKSSVKAKRKLKRRPSKLDESRLTFDEIERKRIENERLKIQVNSQDTQSLQIFNSIHYLQSTCIIL